MENRDPVNELTRNFYQDQHQKGKEQGAFSQNKGHLIFLGGEGTVKKLSLEA